jgi:hypothetical protein
MKQSAKVMRELDRLDGGEFCRVRVQSEWATNDAWLGGRKIEAAYSVNATKTNPPIRTMTTKKNLAIPTNAGMARFVRYVGGCRPGDDSHRLIWEAVCS